jgi:hypothetical protein
LQKDDIAIGVGSVGSGILAFFSWLWSIPILQFGFTFILGTLVTYFIQGRLQDRADKRKIRRENIEKIYGPLKLELEQYRKNIVENLEIPSFQHSVVGNTNVTTWEKVKMLPEFFSIPSKLQLEMEIITRIEFSITEALDEAKKMAESYLLDATDSILSEHLKKNGLALNRESFNRTLYVALRSSTGRDLKAYFLHDCLLLDKNPIELARKEFPEFSFDQSKLFIACYTKSALLEYPPHTNPETLQICLTQIQGEIQQILNEAGTNAKKSKTISKLLEEREELSKRIDKILPTIERYIAKHYPVEEIG